jgi:hypothetical protein
MAKSTEELNALLKEVLSDNFDQHKSKWPEKFSQVFEATSLYVKLGKTKELYLKGANISDHDEIVSIVNFLNETPGIQILMLAGNQIKPQDIKYLLDNCQAMRPGGTITSLNLASNKIGDEGAAHFANRQTSLHVLDLNYNGIGDLGAEHLATNPTIQHLNLGTNEIGPRGAQAFDLGLHKITNLNLQSNEIGADPEQYFKNHPFAVLEIGYQRTVSYHQAPTTTPKAEAIFHAENNAPPPIPEPLVSALNGILSEFIAWADSAQNDSPESSHSTHFPNPAQTSNNSASGSKQKTPMMGSKKRKGS